MTSGGLPVKGTTNGVKSQNAKWFGTDLKPSVGENKATIFRCTFDMEADVIIQYTKNGGSKWQNSDDLHLSKSY